MSMSSPVEIPFPRFDYAEFGSALLELLENERDRLQPDFDESLDYSFDDLQDRMDLFARTFSLAEGHERAYEELKGRWPQQGEPTQAELNALVRAFSELERQRIGEMPPTNAAELTELVDELANTEERILAYLESGRFVFYSPQFSFRDEEMPKQTLNFEINSSFLKFECFFAAAGATAISLTREICSAKTAVLTKLILGRSLLECVLHLHYVSLKFKKLSQRIENKSAEASLNEYEFIPRFLTRAFYGAGDMSESPLHVNDCLDILRVDTDDVLEQGKVQGLYDTLCDFAHPNLHMRALQFELRPTPGDFYTTMLDFDRALDGRRDQAVLLWLLPAILSTAIALTASFAHLDATRLNLNERNVDLIGKNRFNSVTSDWRSRRD